MASTFAERLRLLLVAAVSSIAALLSAPGQAQEATPRPADTSRTVSGLPARQHRRRLARAPLAPTLALLQSGCGAAGDQSAVVFLGDQLRGRRAADGAGMPEPGAPGRAEAEQQLVPLAEALRGYSGEVFVIPGDQDAGDGPDRAGALGARKRFSKSRQAATSSSAPAPAPTAWTMTSSPTTSTSSCWTPTCCSNRQPPRPTTPTAPATPTSRSTSTPGSATSCSAAAETTSSWSAIIRSTRTGATAGTGRPTTSCPCSARPSTLACAPLATSSTPYTRATSRCGRR